MVSFRRSRLQKQEVWRLLVGLWGTYSLLLCEHVSVLYLWTLGIGLNHICVASSCGVKTLHFFLTIVFKLNFFTLLSDPPISIFGFTSPDPPPRLSPDEFIATFPKSVSTHYKHVNLDSKDPSQLDKIGDPSRKSTSETMAPEELSSSIDFTPCFNSDFPFLTSFSLVLSNQRTKSLVDSKVRNDWEGIPVWHVFGDSNPAPLQTSPWLLEDAIGSENINFKLIKNANHFVSFRVFFPLSLRYVTSTVVADVGRA